jgi:cytochrome P450
MSDDGQCRRKSVRPSESDSPPVEREGDVWRVRSMLAARQILREKDTTTQAGFNAEAIPEGAITKPPVLFMDGEPHRRQRSKIARYFAPKTVSTRYRELMRDRAEAMVAQAASAQDFRLDELSLHYSTEVAAEVIGLTHSSSQGLAHRLEKLLDQPPHDPAAADRRNPVAKAVSLVRGNIPMFWFYIRDVRPAIKAHRAQPREDVISHLLAEGYSEMEILIECVTYGAAGMVTTREFISMAAWHLLGDDATALRERYLTAAEPERYSILREILRLEPIVGHLYRRAQSDFTFTDGAEVHQVAKGDLLDLFIRQANADPDIVGRAALDLCPGRQMPSGIGEEVMSFGDGPHKCPGNMLAIQESDTLLQLLLARHPVVVREPSLGWDDLISGYALRGFVLAIPGADRLGEADGSHGLQQARGG